MKNLFAVIIIGLVISGCAGTPQKKLDIQANYWESQTNKVGIAMTSLPEQKMSYPGASCLLCIGAAAIANSKLNEHIKTLSYDELPQLKELVNKNLKDKSIEAVVVTEPLNFETMKKNGSKENFAKYDFSSFKDSHKVDKLLVVEINFIGMTRSYAAYIPTSDPQAQILATAYIVNTSDNSYDSYEPISIIRSANDKWKEPPSYPGLTNAYYQIIAEAIDQILDSFDK